MLVFLGVAFLYGNQKETITGVNARSVGWPISHNHGVMYEVQKYVCDACFAPSCVNHWVCNGKPVVTR